MRVMNDREEVLYKKLIQLCQGDHMLLEKAIRMCRQNTKGDLQLHEVCSIIRAMQ